MADFSYQYLNKKGDTLSGIIEAANEDEAIGKLKSQGLTLLSLKKKNNIKLDLAFFKPKVKLGDLSLFSRQLASLLSAGIPITRSIQSLTKQAANPTLGETLERVSSMIEEGMTLTQALKSFPKIFPELMIAMAESGEISGRMEESLNRIAIQLQKEKMIGDTIHSAMIYPKIIIGFALIIFFAILIFIVPKFESFLPNPEKVPAVTRMVFGFSHHIHVYWYFWILGAIVIFIGLKSLFKNKAVLRFFDVYRFKVPFLGELFYKTVVARFVRTLSSLLESGIPMIQAIQYAGPVSGNIQFVEASNYICEKVTEGKNLSEPFQETGLFQPMVLNMITAGEESGSIPTMLSSLADFYEEEVAILTKGIFSLLEPLLIVFVAVAIGGILMALYLPIFSVVTSQ